MLSVQSYVMVGVSLLAAVVLSFAIMPLVIKLAFKIGAVDIPTDGRRMHNHPIPLLGGLAIIAAFLVSAIICSFYDHSLNLQQILPGALIIAVLGIIDDKHALPAWPKFFVQCIAAGIAVAAGVRVTTINLFNNYIYFDYLSIPITILWIVGITNAVNFIDGLDGLAAGVASIASGSMLIVALMRGQLAVALLTAALLGGCLGLLPYNRNPARVFMGDTGATFLGFVLAIISVQGLFKYTVISFLLPLLILGLPIFDTLSAIVRRLWEHKSPFTADRNHVHHKLIDMGLTQKQAVRTLYMISSVLGVVAILFASASANAGMHFLLIGFAVIVVIYLSIVLIIRHRNSLRQEEQPENIPVVKSIDPNDSTLPHNITPASLGSESVAPPAEELPLQEELEEKKPKHKNA